jgi:hypothetical protein
LIAAVEPGGTATVPFRNARCRPYERVGTQQERETAASGYSIRSPLIARAMTSCWICSVPSKMS